MKRTETEQGPRKCRICGVVNGQLVWRLKVNWRLYMPGPVRGSKDHEQLRDREAANQAFVKSSGLYHDQLETVQFGSAELCKWCERHQKSDPDAPCPRCQPTAPPWLHLPCTLCNGTGVLQGARSLNDVVDRILASGGRGAYKS
jgi:hypothetical protein